jgi:hypothetical protein
MEDAVALLEHPVTRPLELGAGGWQPSEVRRVVVRLTDGEVLQVGTAPNLNGALALARSVIAEIDQEGAEWPLVGDRLLCPDAIVSVDVVTTA